MKISRRCDFCTFDVYRASFAKQITSKNDLEKIDKVI